MLCQQKLAPKIFNKEIKSTLLKSTEIIPERVHDIFWQPVYIQLLSLKE